MKIEHITYENGFGDRGKEVETYNYHKAASVLAEYGFDCVRVSDDWRGADFLAYNKHAGVVLEVQLKACLVIDNKFTDNPDLFICFPLDKTGKWYLLKHSRLLEIVQEHHPKLWARFQEAGNAWHYTGRVRGSKKVQGRLLETLEEYSYEPLYGHLGFRECAQLTRQGS